MINSLKSKVTQRLLTYFFTNKSAEPYINALARLLAVDVKNLERKLKEFEKMGLLKSRFMGKQKHFSLNKDFVHIKEYEKIIQATIGLEAQLKKALKLVKGLKQAYIFGSYVKGKLEDSSDIDILLVGSHSVLETQKALLRIQRNTQREINLIDMSEKEFEDKKRSGEVFLKTVFSEPVIPLL